MYNLTSIQKMNEVMTASRNEAAGTFPASVMGSSKVFLISKEYFSVQFLFDIAISIACWLIRLISSMSELSSIIFLSCGEW